MIYLFSSNRKFYLLYQFKKKKINVIFYGLLLILLIFSFLLSITLLFMYKINYLTNNYINYLVINKNQNINILEYNHFLEITNDKDIENNNEGKLGVHYHEFSWISYKFIFIIKMILFCNRNFFRLLFIGLIILFIIYQNAYFFFEIFS